jgi:hypothetical protein
MFLSKFIYVIDHKTNSRTFFTNHNIPGFGLIAYNIYVRVILALSPKMAPISKKKKNRVKELLRTPPTGTGTSDISVKQVPTSTGT